MSQVTKPSSDPTSPRRPSILAGRSRSPGPALASFTSQVTSEHAAIVPAPDIWFPNHAESSRQALALHGSNSFAFPAESSSRLTISPNDGRDESAALNSATPTYLPLAQSSQTGISPLDTAMTETLERQPRLASGYEWDERHHSVGRGQDGTACLSVEPDGDGYLGKLFIKILEGADVQGSLPALHCFVYCRLSLEESFCRINLNLVWSYPQQVHHGLRPSSISRSSSMPTFRRTICSTRSFTNRLFEHNSTK
jgi:hypothetical protein